MATLRIHLSNGEAEIRNGVSMKDAKEQALQAVREGVTVEKGDTLIYYGPSQVKYAKVSK